RFPGALVNTVGYASSSACYGGRADLARERMAQAAAFAHCSRNPYDIAQVRFYEAVLYLLLREPQRAEAAAAQVLALSEEHDFPFWRNLARARMGWARAQLGNAVEGVALIRQGLAGLAEARTRLGITGYLTFLAEAQDRAGSIA